MLLLSYFLIIISTIILGKIFAKFVKLFFQACASFVRGNDGDEETELRICVEDELDKSQSNISSVTLSNSGFHCDSSHFLTSMSLKNNNCEYSFAVDDRTYCSRHSSESVLSNKTDSIRKSPENQNKVIFYQ